MLPVPKQVMAMERAAGDGDRYALDCVEILKEAEGFRLTATNGRILATASFLGDLNASEVRRVGEREDPEQISMGALVSCKDLAQALKQIKSTDASRLLLDIDSDAEVVIGHLPRAQVSLLKVRDKRLPDWRAVLPKNVPFTISVDAALFIELLSIVKALMVGEDTARCDLHFTGKNKPIGVSAKNANGMFFDGVIMPLS